MGQFGLKSAVFKNGDTIPQKYTCDGDDVNPLLEIVNVPEKTQSLVLIFDDPDATRGGVWDHWLLWNISPKTHYIQEDSSPSESVQGRTSFQETKYGGPCPPRGTNPHRYMFKIYALDTLVDLLEGASKQELEKTMEGHIIEQATLMGMYGRK